MNVQRKIGNVWRRCGSQPVEASVVLPGPHVISLWLGPPECKVKLLENAKLPLGSVDGTQQKGRQLLQALLELARLAANTSFFQDWSAPAPRYRLIFKHDLLEPCFQILFQRGLSACEGQCSLWSDCFPAPKWSPSPPPPPPHLSPLFQAQQLLSYALQIPVIYVWLH